MLLFTPQEQPSILAPSPALTLLKILTNECVKTYTPGVVSQLKSVSICQSINLI